MTEPDYFAALGDAQPLYCTRPTPGAPHDGRAFVKVARALGHEPLPWQVLFARIAGERRIDDPRQYRYKRVIFTGPRQIGKTVGLGDLLTTRGLRNPGRRSFYTAQTGKDASARWRDLIDKASSSAILRDHVQVRLAAGSQSLTLPTGSTIAPFAPTPKSLHGYTPDDVAVDELGLFDRAVAADLMAAVGPAQMTRRSRQLLLLSTRGDDRGDYFEDVVDEGRAAVAAQAAGEQVDTALIEFALPAGLDPHDPASWVFHPAVGHTITIDDLAQLHDLYADEPNTWLRGFMNLRTLVALQHALDPALLVDCYGAQTPPPAGDLVLGYEVAIDRSRSAIWAAWADPATGRPAARLVADGPGAEWLAPAVARARAELRPRAIGADDGGPTRDVTDDLRAREWWAAPDEGDLQILGARDFATGCDALRDSIRRHELLLDPQAIGHLVDDADNAVTRSMGQGWAWDRVKSRGPIADLVALTVAARLNDHAPAPAPSPEVYFA